MAYDISVEFDGGELSDIEMQAWKEDYDYTVRAEVKAARLLTNNAMKQLKKTFVALAIAFATFANHEVQPFANVNFQWNHYHYLSNLGYSGYGSKVVTTTKASKTTVTTDDRTWYLSGNVGGIFTLSKDDVKETYLTTSLSAYVENPINTDEKENAYGYTYSDFKISLPVTYRVIYKATEKLSVGATTATSTWDGIDASVSFKSGFQFNPVKNLSFDCDWGILIGVLGSDLTTDFNEGDGTDATPVNNDIFWQNVNKAFVHNISFIVSYKF